MQPNTTKKHLKDAIFRMNLGDSIDLPIADTVNVRAYASQIGISNGRKYRTATYPNESIIKVERIK